jgi:hypothetical protein
MKRLLLLSLLLITVGIQAQNVPPLAINFQGVAIDKNGVPVPGMDEVGNPIQNAAIRIRFTVLMGSATGTPSYQEEHLTNTDEFGRFNLEIGRGTTLLGQFIDINWGEDRHFLKVETDLTGLGSAYTLSSVQEFLSVPYALYAKTAGNSNDDLDKDPQNEIQTLSLSGNLLSIDQGNTVTLPADSDQQQLSISGAVITISNGNSISLPPDADNQVLAVSGNNLSIANGNTVALPVSPDNQSLIISGNTLSISNGNSVGLPPNTDNQTLAISGNAISISNGNSITLPTAPDNQTLALSGSTLTISNGNSVALPTDSDNQTLVISSFGSSRTMGISGGNNVSFRVNDADSSSMNELQALSKAGNTISLSKNGGSVTDSDNQSLTISGNTLSISNGNSVALPPNTDNQTLAISGNAISISNGNSITLPTAPDNQTLGLSGSTLTISNGNSVALPADSDNQTLSVVSSGNNRTVNITGGNSVNFRVNDADSSATNELQTISLSGNTLSIANGNSVELPSAPNQVDLNQCFSNGSLYLIPSTLPAYIEISAIAFHDSIVLFQLMSNSDTLYYRYNYKNNSINIVNVSGRILKITPIDSLVFLQSKSKLFTYNLENNVLDNISIQCLDIYETKIDSKTKEYYVMLMNDYSGNYKIYRLNPSNNSGAIRSINLGPYPPRFDLFNTDTLVMRKEINFLPVLSYFEFSNNTWINTINPPNVYYFYVDPVERNFLTYQSGETYNWTHELIIHSKNNQFQLSLGRVLGNIFSGDESPFHSTFRFNRNGLFFFNYSSGEVVVNNLYVDQKKQLIEINKSTGEAKMITSFLFNPDKLQINFDNILITPSRRICFNNTYVSQACFMVIE